MTSTLTYILEPSNGSDSLNFPLEYWFRLLHGKCIILANAMSIENFLERAELPVVRSLKLIDVPFNLRILRLARMLSIVPVSRLIVLRTAVGILLASLIIVLGLILLQLVDCLLPDGQIALLRGVDFGFAFFQVSAHGGSHYSLGFRLGVSCFFCAVFFFSFEFFQQFDHKSTNSEP